MWTIETKNARKRLIYHAAAYARLIDHIQSNPPP